MKAWISLSLTGAIFLTGLSAWSQSASAEQEVYQSDRITLNRVVDSEDFKSIRLDLLDLNPYDEYRCLARISFFSDYQSQSNQENRLWESYSARDEGGLNYGTDLRGLLDKWHIELYSSFTFQQRRTQNSRYEIY